MKEKLDEGMFLFHGGGLVGRRDPGGDTGFEL